MYLPYQGTRLPLVLVHPTPGQTAHPGGLSSLTNQGPSPSMPLLVHLGSRGSLARQVSTLPESHHPIFHAHANTASGRARAGQGRAGLAAAVLPGRLHHRPLPSFPLLLLLLLLRVLVPHYSYLASPIPIPIPIPHLHPSLCPVHPLPSNDALGLLG